MTIKNQFKAYLLSMISFCIGAISTKNIVVAGILLFVPIGVLLLLNWDDAKYLERQKKTSEGNR